MSYVPSPNSMPGNRASPCVQRCLVPSACWRRFKTDPLLNFRSASTALYSCNKAGAYAQCNGGLCFNSTIGKPFPKIGPLGSDEIICSCPVVASNSYHVTASATCPTTQAQYDQTCGAGVSTEQSANGVSVYVGSDGPPAGTLALNTLYRATFGGSPSPESVCPYPAK